METGVINGDRLSEFQRICDSGEHGDFFTFLSARENWQQKKQTKQTKKKYQHWPSKSPHFPKSSAD